MKDVHVMESSESFQALIGHLPNSGLINDFLSRLMLRNHLKDVPSLEVLSNNAESVGELIIERVFVAEDVGVVNAGKNSDFIETVSQLFFIEG